MQPEKGREGLGFGGGERRRLTRRGQQPAYEEQPSEREHRAERGEEASREAGSSEMKMTVGNV